MVKPKKGVESGGELKKEVEVKLEKSSQEPE